MKRRSVLKTIAALPLVAAAPSLVLAKGKPQTVDELIEWFESNFKCEIGMPSAYGIVGLPKEKWDAYYDARIKVLWSDYPAGQAALEAIEAGEERYIYTTYCYKGPFDTAEADLVSRLHADFEPFAGKGRELRWRLSYKMNFERFHMPKTYDSYVDETGALVDAEIGETKYVQLRTRIALIGGAQPAGTHEY